jgi:hypothetical protein
MHLHCCHESSGWRHIDMPALTKLQNTSPAALILCSFTFTINADAHHGHGTIICGVVIQHNSESVQPSHHNQDVHSTPHQHTLVLNVDPEL